ncbi:hypothetical protein [Shewanella surugensis]|uniref:Glycoside hydrolase family 5 domain-containing protein n=1 Tax=Shewanella surugensis TaxID=212020 RepID=A0ABT0LKS2_9GAMM|nr:hypothetical protein [Shewanella surugensis]MCL1127990.1 hypothetical protein [Shewanella surugensis]
MVDRAYGSDINGSTIKPSKCYGNTPTDKIEIQQKTTEFYTQNRYKDAFKSYIALLTREFGGFKKIILETGNELGESARYNGVILDLNNENKNKDEEFQFSAAQNQRLIDLNLWTREIALFIKNQYKSRDKKAGLPLVQPHLLMDGSFGVDLGVINNPELIGSLADDNIDIVSNHYYQYWGVKQLYQYDTDKIRFYGATVQKTVASTKPYFVGEFLCNYQCDDKFLTEF